ncbi:hypothetical protein ANME2D_02965 [Candidatus Methanoperedens nitroreducens]|uniref:Uncharacterized protein n=1 Tax=Candidatus Methanoperedens nitratireducens TaxID=1392998 RepID=A0A062V2Y4_9EURY|nr:hypothetical protein [Candidatus Methanoperedens nitroreducens]KCZ70938.1 hypothetical protein ANME2D_02965 [Candidatus Methanoperedens nitroreducens]MDJ1421695.1 hypothetical protein [Candidatus Methanoperedens sp.]
MDDNHKRALSTSLLIIEKDLRNIAGELQRAGGTRDTIFYSKVNDIDQMKATRILSGVQSMLQEIKRVKEEAELGTRKESIEKEVYSLLIEIWTLLEDLRPERLTAYGPLTEKDKELLRPQIQGLLRMVNDMLSALR